MPDSGLGRLLTSLLPNPKDDIGQPPAGIDCTPTVTVTVPSLGTIAVIPWLRPKKFRHNTVPTGNRPTTSWSVTSKTVPSGQAVGIGVGVGVGVGVAVGVGVGITVGVGVCVCEGCHSGQQIQSLDYRYQVCFVLHLTVYMC